MLRWWGQPFWDNADLSLAVWIAYLIRRIWQLGCGNIGGYDNVYHPNFRNISFLGNSSSLPGHVIPYFHTIKREMHSPLSFYTFIFFPFFLKLLAINLIWFQISEVSVNWTWYGLAQWSYEQGCCVCYALHTVHFSSIKHSNFSCRASIAHNIPFSVISLVHRVEGI